ncbi:major facilitator superfamily domain-containing protein [Fennellomyces sp. T-0311]|nr:major facilitator superfamily domain-containing protein [Fennellomyces sp. T-0311]
MGSSTVADFTEDIKSIDDKERRRLVRKIDLRILPLVMIFYICSFLDRANIGNAKIAGLTEDLGMSENDYNIALSMFFVGYANQQIAAEIPCSMILNKIVPKIWISITMVSWGTAGLVPAVLLYLSVWYTRAEIPKRVAIFLASATIAGAYGIMHMDGHRGLHSWHYYALPDLPERSTFLNDREREIFLYKMEKDAIAQKNDIEDDSGHGSTWTPVISVLKDWKTYAFGIVSTCLMTDVYCISLFLPSIVHDLGYTNVLTAQLMTVPPNAIASVLSILNAVSADHFAERGLHVVIPAAIEATGYALLIGLDEENITGHYIAIIVCVCSTTAALAPHSSWFTVNYSGRSKRAVAVSVLTAFGTVGGIIAGQIYRASDAPQHSAILANTKAWILGDLHPDYRYTT